MSADTEHGIKTANWRKNPLNAVPYLDCMKTIASKFEGFEVVKVLPVFTDDDMEVLEANIKKAKRRSEKRNNKFVPAGISKPHSAIRLFQKDDLAVSSAEDRKGYVKNGLLSKHWKALSEEERTRYEQLAAVECKNYVGEYQRQLKAAIENGKWQAPKPKRPLSAYFHFSMSKEMLDACNKAGLKGIQRSKLVSTQWKELTAEARNPFNVLYEKDKLRFEAEMKTYVLQEEERKQRNKDNLENGVSVVDSAVEVVAEVLPSVVVSEQPVVLVEKSKKEKKVKKDKVAVVSA